MKKINLSLLFFFTGVCLAVYSIISNGSKVINVGDTYFVTESKPFAYLMFCLYAILAIVYFIIRRYYNYKVGISHLILFTCSIIYFIATSESGDERFPVGHYTLYSNYFQWKDVYIPFIMISLFLTGNLLFLVNVIVAIVKFINSKRSAST